MKRTPKQRMARRRDRFTVGYIGAKNIVRGTTFQKEPSYIEPLTYAQAEKLLAKMPCEDCAIFELKVVKVNA